MAQGGRKARRAAKTLEIPEEETLSASASAARQLQSLRREKGEEPPTSPKAEAPPKETEPPAPAQKALWTPLEVETSLRQGLTLVLIKNLTLFLLLSPSALAECQEHRLCEPVLSMLALFGDLTMTSAHLMFGFGETFYREDFPHHHFCLLAVLWTVWNLLSHPFWRDSVIDLFVMWPDELHAVLMVASIWAVSATQIFPSWRHLACLVMGQCFLSFALSAAEVSSAYVESLDFPLDSPTVRFDLVIFNIALLIIGTTVALGSLGPEKDGKRDTEGLSLASALHSQAFEDDLERRKRAVLTALCDTVLTTNAHFAVTCSNENADKLFKRPMLHEIFTDYLKDNAEKVKFLSSMKKQFPEDDSLSDGPKRLRVTMRDAQGKPFEADVVVSDASTNVR
ncbi:unnamed protein product, partial [Effrenium voratum]